MCDSGPSRVLRTRTAFCTASPGASSSARATDCRRRDGLHVQHPDRGAQAHADQVFQQAGEAGCASDRWPRARRGRAGQPMGRVPRPGSREIRPSPRQLLEGPPHGDAGHAELLHQRQFAGQAVGETAFVQLLAQHQVDAVVLGQRQGGGHRRDPRGGLECPVNGTFDGSDRRRGAGTGGARGARRRVPSPAAPLDPPQKTHVPRVPGARPGLTPRTRFRYITNRSVIKSPCLPSPNSSVRNPLPLAPGQARTPQAGPPGRAAGRRARAVRGERLRRHPLRRGGGPRRRFQRHAVPVLPHQGRAVQGGGAREHLGPLPGVGRGVPHLRGQLRGHGALLPEGVVGTGRRHLAPRASPS